MQYVFIVGSKGIPGAYGGYETFVEKLTEYHQNNTFLKYHVACKSTESGEYEYNNARCFKINVPKIGAAQAVYYDIAALINCCKYIKRHHIENPIVYILACRVGPFAAYFRNRINRLGGKVFINPDGHEWLRKKWKKPIRMYWKASEQLMVKNADLIICDSKNIEKYIHENYKKYIPRTTFIAYGAETRKSKIKDDDPNLLNWYKKNGLRKKSYYLIVGRFVPENNYKTIIREFMNCSSKRDLVIIATTNDMLLESLDLLLHFREDRRIKFVGTVYNQELLMKIRENAYGYLHGHEVGGTNPSLLEALGSTNLNLLLNVEFNREVAEDGALYWSKTNGDLTKLINSVDSMSVDKIDNFSLKAKKRILDEYSWKFIADRYEQVFLNKGEEYD